jgi:hypothetical protein
MAPRLYLLFNHRLTAEQQQDAHASLQVTEIVQPPAAIQDLWRQIPADLAAIDAYLRPVREWLAAAASKGDYVLIQGDFGACFLMARFAIEMGFIPIYSTTRRQAVEQSRPDGTVKLLHHFRHRRFRTYGE